MQMLEARCHGQQRHAKFWGMSRARVSSPQGLCVYAHMRALVLWMRTVSENNSPRNDQVRKRPWRDRQRVRMKLSAVACEGNFFPLRLPCGILEKLHYSGMLWLQWVFWEVTLKRCWALSSGQLEAGKDYRRGLGEGKGQLISRLYPPKQRLNVWSRWFSFFKSEYNCCSPWGRKELDTAGQMNSNMNCFRVLCFCCTVAWVSRVHTHALLLRCPYPTTAARLPGSLQSSELAPCAMQQLPTICHMVVFTCESPNSPHPPLPPCICMSVLSLPLCSCPENRFICTIFLDFTQMC